MKVLLKILCVSLMVCLIISVDLWSQESDSPFENVPRFSRGNTEYVDLSNFVIPLTPGLRGEEVNAEPDLTAVGSGEQLWFYRTDTDAVYQYTNFPAQHPIAGFGAEASGGPIYTGVQYSLVMYSGIRDPASPDPDIRIRVYNRSDFDNGQTDVQPVAITTVRVPRATEASAWNTFRENGFSMSVNEWGLKTEIQLADFPAQYFGVEQAYVLKHTASSPDYFYIVESRGYYDDDLDIPLVVDDQNEIDYGAMYALTFEQRPPWRATQLDAPAFDGEPLPSEYQGKSAEELIALAGTITATVPVSSNPSQLLLDQSPELRRHPILDQFVSDMGGDPLGLVNYVLNEIDVTDAIAHNADGSLLETSINLGGVQRGALGVYLEEQGSPMEICALLVYLLREAGYEAVYVQPERNQLKMLDKRLSRILKLQVRGALDVYGNIFESYDPAEPHLVPVNYPWVAAYVPDDRPNAAPGAMRWVHIFPWIKDREMEVGLDVYDYLPDDYNSGLKWVKRYLFAETAITSLGREWDTPGTLFPAFVEQQLQLDFPELALDDFGLKTRLRKNYVSRWDDLPEPFRVEGDSVVLNGLSEIVDIFDTIEITVSSSSNPSKTIGTGEVRLMDLHNRRLMISFAKTGTNTHRMSLALDSFRSDMTGTDTFAGGSDLLNAQLQSTILDASDDVISVKYEINKHLRLPDPDQLDVWNTYLHLTSKYRFEHEATISKGDLCAVVMNLGDVTRKMNQVYVDRFQSLQAQLNQDPDASVDSADLQSLAVYLMGMNFYSSTFRNVEKFRGLHLNNNISSFSIGISTLRAERVDGQLPNYGDINLLTPGLDMIAFNAVDALFENVQTDLRTSFEAFLTSDFSWMYVAEGSAQEHASINSYFGQSEAVSTVRLLQLAQTQGTGIVELDRNNYISEGNTVYQGKTLESHASSIWDSIHGSFVGGYGDTFAQTFITAGPVQSGSFEGMGAWVVAGDFFGALINESKNGGTGSALNNDQSEAINENLERLLLQMAEDGTLELLVETGAAEDVFLGGVPVHPTSAPEAIERIGGGTIILDNFSADQQTAFVDDYGLGGFSDAEAFEFGLNTGYLGQPEDRSNFLTQVGDPVHTLTGAFYIDSVDLKLNGPMPLEVRRNYSSQNLAEGDFGYGWKSNYVSYLTLSEDQTVIYAAEMDGTVIAYKQQTSNPNLWLPDRELNPTLSNQRGEVQMGSVFNPYNNQLEKTTEGSDVVYTLTGSEGSQRRYVVRSFPVSSLTRERPYLERWQDNRGNFYSFEYGETSGQNDYGKVRRIQSSNGNFLGFVYDYYGRITEAYTGDARRVYYRYNQYGDLVEATLPDASVIRYEYEEFEETNGATTAVLSNHLLIRERKPEGRILENDYDSERRVTEQRATVGEDYVPVRNATFTYSHTENPDGTLTGYTEVLDAYNRVTRYDYANGLITHTTDAELQVHQQEWYLPGDTSPGAYPRSLKRETDRRGLITEYKYDTQGNINEVKVTGDVTGDGTAETVVSTAQYNSLNLLTEMVDKTGNTVKTFYEDADYPYLPTRIEKWTPAGMVSQDMMTYTEEVEGDIAAYGLLQQQKRAAGFSDEAVETMTYSHQGLMTSRTMFTGTTDPDVVENYSYNLRFELVERQDAAGRTWFYDYDARSNRKAEEIRDENGNLISWQYDYYDGNGQNTWSDGPAYHDGTQGGEDYVWRHYDGAGRLIETSRWRVEAKTDGTGVQPVGGEDLIATTFQRYDLYSNLVQVIDARGHLTEMDHDGIGQMTERRYYSGASPTGTPITELFDHEPGGLVSFYQNPEGGITRTYYTHDGKPKRQENPDGTELEWRYYQDGRLFREILTNDAYWEISYDDFNQTETRTYYTAGGSPLGAEVKSYDRRGNLISTTDMELNTFTNSYDDLNRPKSSTGPAASASSARQNSTIYYDAAGIEVRMVNGLNEEIVERRDVLGRPISKIVKASDGNLIRETSYTYTANHYGNTVTLGTGLEAITATTYSDITGNAVLRVDAEGGITRSAWDAMGNRVLTVDPLGREIRCEYDYRNRLQKKVLADGAEIVLGYDDNNNLETRSMPGGITWTAQYDNANRIETQSLTDGAATTRSSTYTYYPSGSFVGRLQTVTDPRGIVSSYQYDDFLRVEEVSSASGNPSEVFITDFAYDLRNLVEEIDQTSGGISTTVNRGYDSYGQLTSEAVERDGMTVSSFSQTWDGAGRRSSLTELNSQLSPPGFQYDYWPDGRMKQVTANGQTYDFAFNSAGFLKNRTNSFRVSTVQQRDGVGRMQQCEVDVSGSTAYSEALTWNIDGTLATHDSTRVGASVANDQRIYTYDERIRVTTEKFTDTAAERTPMSHEFDFNQTAGIGIKTRSHTPLGSSLFYNRSVSNVDGFQRVRDELTNSGEKAFTADGNALGAESVEIRINGELQSGVNFDPASNNGAWSLDLNLPAGRHTLQATAYHPSGEYQSTGSSAFTVTGSDVTIHSAYDDDGNLVQRTLSDGSTLDYSWDGLGRLIAVAKRDAADNGFNWSATYDGLNRRILSNYEEVVTGVANSPLVTMTSYFDPLVEFLELAVTRNDQPATETWWKVYGPDLNGGYGSLQGIGGLEAVIRESDGQTVGLIHDHYGHTLGRIVSGSVTWSEQRAGGYGLLPESTAEHFESGVDYAETLSWRGKRHDMTGLIFLGARHYDPYAGRFISPDPAGHQGSMDLYAYANGDPINLVDPDGRFGVGAIWDPINSAGISLAGAIEQFVIQPGQAGFAGQWQGQDVGFIYSTSFTFLDNLIAGPGASITNSVNDASSLGSALWANPFQTSSQLWTNLTTNLSNQTAREWGTTTTTVVGATTALVKSIFSGKSIFSFLTDKTPDIAPNSGDPNYVYRALNTKDADRLVLGLGLEAKNPVGGWSLGEHVSFGSSKASWLNDPWISTTTDLNVARAFDSGKGIIKIDLNKVPSLQQRAWELYPRVNGADGLPYHYSIWQQETSIFQSIPAEAIQGFVK